MADNPPKVVNAKNVEQVKNFGKRVGECEGERKEPFLKGFVSPPAMILVKGIANNIYLDIESNQPAIRGFRKSGTTCNLFEVFNLRDCNLTNVVRVFARHTRGRTQLSDSLRFC